jgi:glycosyltransferase involved in cell wall biosynthesis
MGKNTADAPILVAGTRNWLSVTANLLEKAGLTARVLNVQRKWLPFALPFAAAARRAAVVHMVWGADFPASLVATALLRKPLVWHWVGSDVIRFRSASPSRRARLQQIHARHVLADLADSPELAVELEELGIHATVCRLLPAGVRADVMPMPADFTVLSYWSDEQFEFYGGPEILEAARRLPDVEFLIVGAKGEGLSPPPNVKFLGRVQDMESVYRQTAVFVRMPKHDSVSAMVLEALGRGRYVVANRPFPHCLHAAGSDDLVNALAGLRGQKQSNEAGAAYVRANFNPEHEAAMLARVYRPILDRLAASR